MKPLFLDNPPFYTRTQNEVHDPIRYSCGIYQVRPSRPYGWAWWLAMALVCVAALLVVTL